MQLGQDVVGDSGTPRQIFSKKFKTIEAGVYSISALAEDDTLWEWGMNFPGNSNYYGNVQQTTEYEPKQVSTKKYKALAAGDIHYLALAEDGTLWARGWNFVGQLGDGTTSYSDTPKQIGSKKYSKIFATYKFSMALDEDGVLWRWGETNDGQPSNLPTKATLP